MRAHVQKRGLGYLGIVYLGRGADGKKRYRYLPTVPTEEQAQVMIADAIGELYRGMYIEPTKTTFWELLDRWLAHKSRRGRKPKTIAWYRTIIQEHLRPALGHILLQRLTPLDLESYHDRALASGQKTKAWDKKAGARPSETSMAGYHRLIYAALARAFAWRLIAANPADLVELPQPAEGLKRTSALAQVTNLLAAAVRKARQVELYVLAVTKAMHEGELLDLRWQSSLRPFPSGRPSSEQGGTPNSAPSRRRPASERSTFCRKALRLWGAWASANRRRGRLRAPAMRTAIWPSLSERPTPGPA